MKVTIHAGWLIFFGLVLIFGTYWLTEYFNEPSNIVTIKKRKDYNLVTFRLPNSKETEVFGAPFWKARHTLAELIPCSICREDAVSHEIFFHDYVNKKIGKKIKFKKNYEEWEKKICEEDKDS